MLKKWAVSTLCLLAACTRSSDSPQQSEHSSVQPAVAQPTPSIVVADKPGPSKKPPSQPLRWLPERIRCSEKGGKKFCDGPRRVVMPSGVENDFANSLGLGTFACAAELLRGHPDERWRVVEGDLPAELHWPIKGGRFGRGLSQKPKHRGVDITAESGRPVHLVADGLVAYANNEVSGYGNLLIVIHAKGAVSAYAHLSEIRVFPGQRLAAGDLVALTGNTGLSRGPHLHFEWREHGRSTDPMQRFSPIHRRGGR